MAGFRAAKAGQAALKMAIYGPAGSGKTLTSLLIAEGLAALAGGRVALVDTERGSDFYCAAVPERSAHPAAFDFDALYTRSLTEAVRECQGLDPKAHPVVVIDSITHLWEAARNAYAGRTNKAGQIPMHAWGEIKRPYKALMHWALNCPQHVLICGRQGNDWGEDEQTGELVNQGYKMRAEGETAYEPHVLLRLEVRKGKQRGVHVAHVEKDRTGKLHGRIIEWPSFASVAEPLLGLLGGTQVRVQSEDEAAAEDAEALTREERERAAASRIYREQLEAKLTLARTPKEVRAVGEQITAELKRVMLPADVAALRESYLAAMRKAESAVKEG